MDVCYSTDAVNQSQRFEYWSDVVCKHFIPAASHVPDRKNFDAAFAVRTLGQLTLARMTSPLHSWTREESHLRSGPNDDFMLSLMVSGEGKLAQGGRQVVQRTSDIVLYDAARPFSFDLAPKSTLLLRIPRRQLLFRVPEAENLTAMQLASGHPIARLLGNMIGEAAVLDLAAHEGLQARFASSLLDMLSVLLQFQLDESGGPRSTHDLLYMKACDYIASQFDDCELDLEQLAAALHTSARTLMRVFAEHGSTPMPAVWKQRLSEAYAALSEGRTKQVTQAAFQSGFSDLSHFCRLFKKTFGVTPHTLLRGH